MTREEAIQWLKHINITDFGWDDYAMQDSQKEIRERCEQSIREAIDMAIEALSADAEQGEWEFVDNEIFAGEYFCSICGKRAEVDLYGEWILSNYCGHCGARMKGGVE